VPRGGLDDCGLFLRGKHDNGTLPHLDYLCKSRVIM
jgi:hypothetical protein